MSGSLVAAAPADFAWRPITLLPPDAAAAGSSWAGHLPFAYWLVDVLRPAVIVDLADGVSCAFQGFRRAADHLGLTPSATALSISDGRELEAGAADTGGLRLIAPAELALAQFADGSIDLLHLDAAALLRDGGGFFQAWLPKMSRRGVILADEVLTPAHDGGVWAWWSRVSPGFAAFLFPHGGGLGVLGVGGDLPGPLAGLFAAEAEGGQRQAEICALFERLGRIDLPNDAEARYAAAAGEVRALEAQIREFQASLSWRITGPLRDWKAGLTRLRRRFAGQPPAPPVPPPAPVVAGGSYETWVALYDTLQPLDILQIRNHIRRLKSRPLFSVVMPVYNIKEEYLRRALDSVLDQLYDNWELCISDDASPLPHIATVLDEYQRRDQRIKVTFRQQNGHVAVATNTALAMARGDFVVLMDHDDELPRHCLYMLADEIERHPDADILYSDEDKIDAYGNRWDPYFKSDWNPDLACGQNMVSHIGVYRRGLLEAIGGFRAGYEGSQDYDLMLRAIGQTTAERIRHIPFILYHWRVFAQSGSISTAQLGMASDAARRAVADHLARSGIRATVAASPLAPDFSRVRHDLPEQPPLVSLIVPTKDRVTLLSQCVEGLLRRTDYDNLEVLIVDNGSREAATHRYFKSLADQPRVRVLTYDGPFNYSAINNYAVTEARGEIIGLINNDIDVISADWLREMVSHALRPEVGAVGAKLFYADDTIQHAGVVLGMGGVAGHPFRLLPRGNFYFQRPNLTQNISAVTAACLVIRKEVYQQIGGLDEVNLQVAFNDVDFCIRLREAGYLNVWTPFAELYHLESASRGDDMAPAHFKRFMREIDYMQTRWGAQLKNDPYFSPNLALDSTDFTYAFPPRVDKPWKAGLKQT